MVDETVDPPSTRNPVDPSQPASRRPRRRKAVDDDIVVPRPGSLEASSRPPALTIEDIGDIESRILLFDRLRERVTRDVVEQHRDVLAREIYLKNRDDLADAVTNLVGNEMRRRVGYYVTIAGAFIALLGVLGYTFLETLVDRAAERSMAAQLAAARTEMKERINEASEEFARFRSQAYAELASLQAAFSREVGDRVTQGYDQLVAIQAKLIETQVRTEDRIAAASTAAEARVLETGSTELTKFLNEVGDRKREHSRSVDDGLNTIRRAHDEAIAGIREAKSSVARLEIDSGSPEPSGQSEIGFGSLSPQELAVLQIAFERTYLNGLDIARAGLETWPAKSVRELLTPIVCSPPKYVDDLDRSWAAETLFDETRTDPQQRMHASMELLYWAVTHDNTLIAPVAATALQGNFLFPLLANDELPQLGLAVHRLAAGRDDAPAPDEVERLVAAVDPNNLTTHELKHLLGLVKRARADSKVAEALEARLIDQVLSSNYIDRANDYDNAWTLAYVLVMDPVFDAEKIKKCFERIEQFVLEGVVDDPWNLAELLASFRP